MVSLYNEDAFKVNVEEPENVGGFKLHTDELPIPRLPAGKYFNLRVSRFMDGGEAPHGYCDITVTALLADGTSVSEDIFAW